MGKINLTRLVESELERLYHNATLSYVETDSDYECDLVHSQLNSEIECAFSDIKYTCPKILNYGKVYSWGRGGRTVAPEDLIKQRGGSSFSIKTIEDLEMSPLEFRELYKTLNEFNNMVEEFCKHQPKACLEFIREEYKTDLNTNKNKKRKYFSGVRYE